jgi:hypothetical protein
MRNILSDVLKLTGLNLATIAVVHGINAFGNQISYEASKRYGLFKTTTTTDTQKNRVDEPPKNQL